MRVGAIQSNSLSKQNRTMSKVQNKDNINSNELQSDTIAFKKVKRGLKRGGAFFIFGALFGAILVPVHAILTGMLMIGTLLGSAGFFSSFLEPKDKEHTEN